MDYCDQSSEVSKNPMAKEIMARIANGDAHAFEWMWAFWNFEHVLDDLVDKDKSLTSSDVAGSLVSFVIAMTANPFYTRNSATLLPLIISACNRWVDGDDLATKDDASKIRAEVVRCGDIDIYLHVAYLTGGWEHMRAVSPLARQYDPDDNITTPSKT